MTSGTRRALRCDAEIIQSERMLREENRRLREDLRLATIQATRAERAMLEGQGYEYFSAGNQRADRLASSLRWAVRYAFEVKRAAKDFLACL